MYHSYTMSKVIVISGSMGSGKSTVLAEASDLLAARGVVHAAAGVTRLLLAEAVESRAELDRIQKAIPGSTVVVCRLRAKLETMRQRVSLREPGMLREQFVDRVTELDALLDRAQLEDLSLVNDDGSVTDVARELLTRAGWI
jgi:thymidine kinase